MGVIRKMLGRANVLNPVRFRYLFLDMEENIHIHYRDLRIELSRAEFEEICTAFLAQSEELLGIIRARDYQDGKLPNANQDEVRIWTDAKLESDVKYHPTRVSVEECTDGYHLHLRNYKLLFSREEMEALLGMLRDIDLDSPYAAEYDTVLQLLLANDIDFTYDENAEDHSELLIRVEHHHVKKIEAIFKGLPFTRSAQNDTITFTGKQLTVRAVALPAPAPKPDTKTAAPSGAIRPLRDHLQLAEVRADGRLVNRIKLQVLNMLGLADANDGVSLFNLDFNTWLFDEHSESVVFPYQQPPANSPKAVSFAYRRWSEYLRSLKLDMFKPHKTIYPAEQQAVMHQALLDFVKQQLAIHPAVNKVYLMGSGLRKELGIYDTPFIHSRWAKVGSDLDVLIELTEGSESQIPEHWKFINRSSNTCDVYHVGELPIKDGEKVARENPYVTVWQHLVDAYIYVPGSSDEATKDAFLKKFAAKTIFEREDCPPTNSDANAALATEFETTYGFAPQRVEKMQVATENVIFHLVDGEREYVLKKFLVGGNYSRTRLLEHVQYECKLVAAIALRGIPTAAIIPGKDGELVAHIDGHPMVLFDMLPGHAMKKPEYPLESVATLLAAFHQTQLSRPLDLEPDFTFRQVTEIWWPTLPRFRKECRDDKPLSKLFKQVEKLLGPYKRLCAPLLEGENWLVHNHGDLTPRNIMLDALGNTYLFDFQNAFYGPRLLDVLDGAYEFSLAGKYINSCDFNRYFSLIDAYVQAVEMSTEEQAFIQPLGVLMGILKFVKEVRMSRDHSGDNLRRQRAMAIAGHLLHLAGEQA